MSTFDLAELNHEQKTIGFILCWNESIVMEEERKEKVGQGKMLMEKINVRVIYWPG